MMRNLQSVFIGLTTVAVGLAYVTGHLENVALVVVLLGVFWITGHYKGWNWLGSIMFLVFVGFCTVGLYFNLSREGLFVGLIGALSAFDMNRFEQRKTMAGMIKRGHDMEKRHLFRLVAVIFVSLVLGIITASVKIKIEFGAVLTLGLLAVLCLNRVTVYLKRENKDLRDFIEI